MICVSNSIGLGAKWWDGLGDKGVKKPKFLRIKTTGGSVFEDIKILNCPHQCVSINSASDTTIKNFDIEVTAGDTVSSQYQFNYFCLLIQWCCYRKEGTTLMDLTSPVLLALLSRTALSKTKMTASLSTKDQTCFSRT